MNELVKKRLAKICENEQRKEKIFYDKSNSNLRLGDKVKMEMIQE